VLTKKQTEGLLKYNDYLFRRIYIRRREIMKYFTLTLLLSYMINLGSAQAQEGKKSEKQLKKTEKQLRKKEERAERYEKTNNKINKQIRDREEKRQRDILTRNILTHEERVKRRDIAREQRIIREHILEYKRKSNQDDKITARKTKKSDRKFDNEHQQIVKANKKHFGTKDSRNNFRTDKIDNASMAASSGPPAKKKPKNTIAVK
jgi:hypothetical protein